jgi:hypothetical protein
MVRRASYSIVAAAPGTVPDHPGGLASCQFKLDGDARSIVRSVRGELESLTSSVGPTVLLIC